MISLERVVWYLQGNNSINALKHEFKTFLYLERFPYFKVLLKAGTTVPSIPASFTSTCHTLLKAFGISKNTTLISCFTMDCPGWNPDWFSEMTKIFFKTKT